MLINYYYKIFFVRIGSGVLEYDKNEKLPNAQILSKGL